MNKLKSRYIAGIIVLLGIALLGVSVIAQTNEASSDAPKLPGAYYGKITVSNKEVKDGLDVKAKINGVECSQESKTSSGMYLLIVRRDNNFNQGCQSEDETILYVNDVEVGKLSFSDGSFVNNDIKIEPSLLKGNVNDFLSNDKSKDKNEQG